MKNAKTLLISVNLAQNLEKNIDKCTCNLTKMDG